MSFGPRRKRKHRGPKDIAEQLGRFYAQNSSSLVVTRRTLLLFRGCESGDTEGQFAVPGACAPLAEWNFAHAPREHRSLLAEIDVPAEKGLASAAVQIGRAH